MRVAIVGSRKILSIDLDEILKRIPQECSEIVSGGAAGADQLAKQAAALLQVPMTEFYPDYASYGKSAPHKRNEKIAAYCDMMIAVWDYHSKGTRHALLQALKYEKKVQVIIVH